MSATGKRGWPGKSMDTRFPGSTVGPPVWSSRTSISGRAPSGSPACAYSTMTNQASGKSGDITITGIRGSSNDMMVTDPANVEAGPWRSATVISVHPETATAKTLRMRLPEPSAHLAGQHYIVRLTAPDGYTASRSYSVASAPDGSSEIELTVERLPDGEVSAFLHDALAVG